MRSSFYPSPKNHQSNTQKIMQKKAKYELNELQFLFEIEYAFEITGRGLVLMPSTPNTTAIHMRDSRLLAITPEGEQTEFSICGVEMLFRGKPMDHIPILTNREIKKENVPTESKIYSIKGRQL